MTAKQQTEILANYIMANFPEDIIDGGAGDVAIIIMERLRKNILCKWSLRYWVLRINTILDTVGLK